jgi:hypothetical protein
MNQPQNRDHPHNLKYPEIDYGGHMRYVVLEAQTAAQRQAVLETGVHWAQFGSSLLVWAASMD